MSLAKPHCTRPQPIFVIVAGGVARGGGDSTR